MIKSLLNKLFRKLAKMTTPKVKTVEEYCKERASAGSDRVTVSAPRTNEHIDINTVKTTMQERILEADEIRECLTDISAQLFSKGYRALREVLEDYPVEVIQAFVLMQKNSLGEYAPESDNLEAYTREDLLESAIELNQMQYELRMINAGKAQVTDAQKKALAALSQKHGIELTARNKFEASRIISKYMSDSTKDVKMVGNITEKQSNILAYLCKKLEYPTVPVCKNVKEASAWINKLQQELAQHPELNVERCISKKQINYIKRLYQQLGKRFTKTQLMKVSALNAKQASEMINELNTELKTNHPETLLASAGQKEYIKSLSNALGLPCPANLDVLSKDTATTVINGLSRNLLFRMCKGNTNLSKDDIEKMTNTQVNAMIKQLREEKQTRNYTVEDDNTVVPF